MEESTTLITIYNDTYNSIIDFIKGILLTGARIYVYVSPDRSLTVSLNEFLIALGILTIFLTATINFVRVQYSSDLHGAVSSVKSRKNKGSSNKGKDKK